jgi:hypothetical protein
LGFEEEEEEEEDEGLVIDELDVGVARVEISEEMGTRVSGCPGRSCGTTFGSCESSSMMRTQIWVLEVLHRPQSQRVHKNISPQALQNPFKWHSGVWRH